MDSTLKYEAKRAKDCSSEAEEAGARLARNCGKPGFCASKNAPCKRKSQSQPTLFSKEEREAWYKTESFRKTGLSVSNVENLVQSEAEKIQGLKSSPDKNVIIFSKTKELDREMGYNAQDAEQNRNAIIARIEPVMQSRNTEETVRELNGKLRSADIFTDYKVAEINTNGRLSRELAGAVTQADFASERNRIIFGEDTQKAVPAKKGDGKPLYTLANPKAEKTENSPTPYQSARQQAQSQFLTETTEEIAESNVSKYTKGGQIFPTDYNSGTESHVSVQEKHGTGKRHNAELAAGDIPAGSDAGIIDNFTKKAHLPCLSEQKPSTIPKICVLMQQTVWLENHSSEMNPLIPAQQTAQAMPPPAKELHTLPLQATKAGLRTLFSQSVKTGMAQRKPGHHILPYIAGRTAVPPKKQDKIHHSLAEIYLVRQSQY